LIVEIENTKNFIFGAVQDILDFKKLKETLGKYPQKE
jgi:hypothetical protein